MSTTKRTLQKLFCLDGLLLEAITEEETGIYLAVRSPRTTAICPKCAQRTRRVEKRAGRTVKHGFCNNQLVWLRLVVRTFRCRSCGGFREAIPGVDRRRTTARFRSLVLPKVRDRSFSAVGREFGLSAHALIDAARQVTADVGQPWPTKPFRLGLDEHSFSGRDLMITLTDTTNRRLIEILRNDRNTTLTAWLQNLPEEAKSLIQSVCIDMRQGYRSVVEDVLPGMPIVIDKFHVIQLFNWHLGQLRLLYTTAAFPLPKKLLEINKEDLAADEDRQLQAIFRRYPAIAEFWRMKEIMRQIYRLHDPQKATRRFDSLLDGLSGDDRLRWQDLSHTLTRWRTEILNYFSHGRTTNAYTEGVHTRIKLLKRISYGFRNKANYIAKMTLAFVPLLTIMETLKHHPV